MPDFTQKVLDILNERRLSGENVSIALAQFAQGAIQERDELLEELKEKEMEKEALLKAALDQRDEALKALKLTKEFQALAEAEGSRWAAQRDATLYQLRLAMAGLEKIRSTNGLQYSDIFKICDETLANMG